MTFLSPTPPICRFPQENFQFSERVHLEFSKFPPDLPKIEELVIQEFTKTQQDMIQDYKWKVKETFMRIQNENLTSDLKQEKEKNNYLKEKVKKLKTELSEKKEGLVNKQILTFGKILRFIYDKFAAFFSQKRDAIVHFWNPHSTKVIS